MLDHHESSHQTLHHQSSSTQHPRKTSPGGRTPNSLPIVLTLTIRGHAAAQTVCPAVRLHVPAIHGRAANNGTLVAEMPEPSAPLGVFTADPEKVLAQARDTF